MNNDLNNKTIQIFENVEQREGYLRELRGEQEKTQGKHDGETELCYPKQQIQYFHRASGKMGRIHPLVEFSHIIS